MVEQFGKLYDIVDTHNQRYPVGDSPYPLLNRLLEQAEETAEKVGALERSRSPDPGSLADELRELLHSTLALARRYGIEDRLEAVIDSEHLRLTEHQTFKHVHKAVCYIVRDDHLLVFRHVNRPFEEVGVQVPAGTVRIGEAPADAALREAREETGLPNITLVDKVGETVFDARPYLTEIQHRHFYLMKPVGEVPERWSSTEDHDGAGDPTEFECFWIPLVHAHVLQGAQSQLIGRATHGRR